MNMNAVKLRMHSTNFDSPHGLMNKFNYSTAYDMCLLTSKCMQIPLFREIVSTKVYTAQPIDDD
jgi:D-alanyl-D-alanine carboxypeptidase